MNTSGDYLNEELQEERDPLIDFPELKISLSDEELLKLTRRWRSEGEDLQGKMKTVWDENSRLWLGTFDKGNTLNVDDWDNQENRLFSALETFLPILTRQNPDPLVTGSDPQLVKRITVELQRLTDTQKLKLKIKRMSRYWSLYQLGVFKIEWDVETKETKFIVKNPQKLLLDSKGYVEDGVYYGRFIGEKISIIARDFIKKYPKSKQEVERRTKGNLDAFVEYCEWWTNEYLIIQYGTSFPFKSKNPHFNYEKEEESVDEFGEEMIEVVKPRNQFKKPQIPFCFLHVYETKASVFDETGLIQQAKPNQQAVNRRIRQIDKNVQNQNNSLVMYGIDEQKATNAVKQLNSGGAVIFADKTTEGVERASGNPLPPDVYNNLGENKTTIDSIFATNAVTRGEETRDTTVRGKIIAKQSDESRIGFLAEFMEQTIDQLYNYATQMMYVYYDNKEEMPETPYVISVKEGSMIPKDPLTMRNEAVDLFSAGAMDILTLYERLDVEDPLETAKRTALYNLDPMLYLQEVIGFVPNINPMPQAPGEPIPQSPIVTN